MAQYLDPNNTGAQFVDTLAASSPPQPPTTPPPPPPPPPPPTPPSTPCDGVNIKVDVLTDNYP